MKNTLTSFDIAAIVSELKKLLEGSRIQNIYQTKGKTITLKLHQPSQPPLTLLIKPGNRLHLTSYVLEKPQKPPAFCMALRKYLRNSVLSEISQYEFERIVIIKAKTKGEDFRLVLELFGEGNVLLVDAQDVIQQALTFRRMRDRNILKGESFQQAPSSGKNPLQLDSTDLLELKDFKDSEVVKAITKFLSISGMYAEEILLRAQVDKNMRCEALKDDDLDKIFRALGEILFQLKTRKFRPCIVMDEKGEWVDVVPFRLRKYDEQKCKEFESFNEALDEYYAKIIVEQEALVVTEKVEQKIATQKRILDDQQASIRKDREQAERLRKVGDKIYVHFHQLQALLERIMDEKRRGKTWQKIISKIENEKKIGRTPSNYFESLETRNLVLNLSIDDLSFPLKLRKSVQENAANYYNRAKKAEKKVKGAEKALEETLKRIEELKRWREIVVEETGKPIKKQKKKAWYEKFRWFYTSENLLVVGGKDAITNEILIKKHTEPHDLVFHADIAGAPFVLIKSQGKMPSQQSIQEAAQLAASYSRAWKAKFTALDVYWVHPRQVSKTPPSGEYVKKGAFIIRGQKNYIRKTQLHLSIGIDTNTTSLTVIGGPKDAIKSKTSKYVEIVPGDLPSRQLANKIKQALKQRIPENLQKKVSQIPIEQIQAFIPFGKGRMINK